MRGHPDPPPVPGENRPSTLARAIFTDDLRALGRPGQRRLVCRCAAALADVAAGRYSGCLGAPFQEEANYVA
jgi:hypothetical protein